MNNIDKKGIILIFLTDTCFWTHTNELNENNIWNINEILFSFRVCTTDAVKKEIIHFKLDKFVPLDRIFIISVSTQDFAENSNNLPDIDEADQSLIIAARKNPNEKPIILSDDGELISEIIQTGMLGMRPPVFILMLIKWGLVTKNLGARCLKFWEKVGRFKKRELIKWKNELKMIN